jgi:hypothetical protein
MLTQSETRATAKAFYEGILAQRNVGHLAFLLNMSGHKELMSELFIVRGFKELLAAALPSDQHNLGHLGK